MAWITVALLSLLELRFPAVAAHKPTVSIATKALFVGLLSIVADLSAAVAVVLHCPHGHFLPGGLLGTLCAVIVADALWYCLHRLSHGPILWPLHRWHHAPETLNIWVYYLGHPLFQALAALVRYLPLWLLGATTAQLAFVGTLQFLWSAWAHCNLSVRIPVLEGWLLGPLSHAWHHARGSHVNYGILLGLWDRLGGTLRIPSANLGQRRRMRYGVRDPGPGAWALFAQLAYPFAADNPGGPGGGGKRSASVARRHPAPPSA